MKVVKLPIDGAWLFEPTSFPDHRGSFTVPYQAAAFREALGFELHVAQTNMSVSHRGVVRGVHWADVPPGQAKYLYVVAGSIRDVIVDLRVGSSTFGRYEAVDLDAASSSAVYLAEGLGHGFQALDDHTVVTYLCSIGYSPAGEHGINPLDPALDLPWSNDLDVELSEKDAAAPSLAEAMSAGLLPDRAVCDEFSRSHPPSP